MELVELIELTELEKVAREGPRREIGLYAALLVEDWVAGCELR